MVQTSDASEYQSSAPTATRPRLLSGIMPTGDLHVGNYLGAIVNWTALQATHEAFFCVVDLHAITTPQDPRTLRAKVREVAALFIAAGIDPIRSAVFVQSHVPAHAQLAWILNCIAPVGRLERMTQFKEKAEKSRAGASVGLFDYPVLQAADILLYGGTPPRDLIVPIGDDQRQHLELARDLAERFNHLYQEAVFAVPRAYIPPTGARIRALDDPTKKMSKSAPNPASRIHLLDSPDQVRRKIARAVTDPGHEVRFDPERPGLENLLTLYERFSGESRARIESHFAGRGYAALKRELADLISARLAPIQETYRRIRSDDAELERVLARGAERARAAAAPVLAAASDAVGLG